MKHVKPRTPIRMYKKNLEKVLITKIFDRHSVNGVAKSCFFREKEMYICMSFAV